MIDRAAVILKYKAPAIQWINEADPYEDNPGITEQSVNEERTVYLISDEDGETQESLERWVKRNYKEMFDRELEGWYTDPALWPQERTLKLFREWFEVECHTVLIDMAGGPIHDDDI